MKNKVRRQRKEDVQKVAERSWKGDAFTRAPIDAMEMQILRQILSRIDAREQGKRKKERERKRLASVRN